MLKVPDSPVILRPYDPSENDKGIVPEFTILIFISSPFLKSDFSVTTETEGPSTKTSWLVLLTSIR